MLKQAFKEWAAVCLALAEGRQSLLLRKGGIAETSVDFRPEHNRFWLYPTYTHQQAKALLPDAAPLLAQSESERPRSGVVRLSHFAEVSGVYHVHDLVPVLMLGHMHIWSEETVRARFAYRRPGICASGARVPRSASTRGSRDRNVCRLPHLGRAGTSAPHEGSAAGDGGRSIPRLAPKSRYDPEPDRLCMSKPGQALRPNQILSFPVREL